MFGDPVGIAGSTVEGGGEGKGGAEVGDGAGETVLEEAGGVNGILEDGDEGLRTWDWSRWRCGGSWEAGCW